jgi:hypothetical protein
VREGGTRADDVTHLLFSSKPYLACHMGRRIHVCVAAGEEDTCM